MKRTRLSAARQALAGWIAFALTTSPARLVASDTTTGASPPTDVYLVPNFHPGCMGWLVPYHEERNYCLYSYLAHVDRVAKDATYKFAFSELPHLITMLELEPERFAQFQAQLQEGRAEVVNAFVLEPTVNLSGGEALVKQGVEGLRWYQQVLGRRPRYAWMIDITGWHEQMAQIVPDLGLEAFVYTRYNPTPSALHWIQAPDGTRTLALAPGHYAELSSAFGTAHLLSQPELRQLIARTAARQQWYPAGMPFLVLGGAADYALPFQCESYPRELVTAWNQEAPGLPLRLATLSDYVDAVRPGLQSRAVALPTVTSGSAVYGWSSFWMNMPKVKQGYRRAEHALQSAEALATFGSLAAATAYPAQPLGNAWLLLALNMDRAILWGVTVDGVISHPQGWDAFDRFRYIEEKAAQAQAAAIEGLAQKDADSAVLCNPANAPRTSPFELRLPKGLAPAEVPAQWLEDGETLLAEAPLPSMGLAPIKLTSTMPPVPEPTALPAAIETGFYSARIDAETGALVSLRLKPSGHELLGGPANVVLVQVRTNSTASDPHNVPERSGRRTVGSSDGARAALRVTTGPLATIVEAQSPFHGGGLLRRVMRFYAHSPRIDFETEVGRQPDGAIVSVEFPLAHNVTEVRRGIPFGFSHGAWTESNPRVTGTTKGIIPVIRWSDYALAGGGGVALLDRGVPARELAGNTVILLLNNVCESYYGRPVTWMAQRGEQSFSYALLPHDADWSQADIPQAAWQYNAPVTAACGYTMPAAKSFVQTSENVLVEALRREGNEIELRLVECLGQAGNGTVRVDLPHDQAMLTDLLGEHRQPLTGGPEYTLRLRPQQIVTMRLRTAHAVAPVAALRSFESVIPPAKREFMRTFRDPKLVGHPPLTPLPPSYLKATPEVVEGWKDRRFGLFVCWGPVSLTGKEIGWSRGAPPWGLRSAVRGGRGDTPADVYDNLYHQWKPDRFNAREWVRVAQEAGAKYLIFLVKHHDGFALYDTRLTDYRSTGPDSAWNVDVLKEIADACHEANLPLIPYYSQPDWHHPDFGGEHHDRYIQYLHGQVRELLTHYGRLDGLWFDGLGAPAKEWDATNLFKLARELQPHLVINDRCGLPGDYDTPEQFIGRFQTDRPWESCITLGTQWSWKPDDTLKSLPDCIGTLVRCACRDGNLALNTNPMPDGRIEPRQVERFREIGAWLKQYGESIYGTRGGPFVVSATSRGAGSAWDGGSTHRGNAVYLHILHWPGGSLALPPMPRRLLRATTLTGGNASVEQTTNGLTITLPPAERHTFDTIVKLELDGPAKELPLIRSASGSLTTGRKATASNFYQEQSEYGPEQAVDDDLATRWGCDWGTHSAWLEVDLGEPRTFDRGFISEPYDRVRRFELQARRGDTWETFHRGTTLGENFETRFAPVTARQVRLNLLETVEGPSIWEFQLFHDVP